MNLNETILKVFNINPTEKSRVLLLILHSFFLGVYVSYFFSFANGIFLSEFEIKFLPFAYVVSGILGFLFSSIFSFIQRKIKYFNLLVGVLVLVLLVTILFVVGFKTLEDTKWLIFIVFVCVGPIFSLMNLSFWGLTISLFDLREGKRLFGLIGSGDVISSILGYFSIPFVIQYIGDSSNLMVISIVGLAISIMFQWIIINRLPEAKEVENLSKTKSPKPALSFKEIVNNKYFRFIFLLVIFSMVSQYFVDYNFMGIARSQMQDKIELTSFIGIFFGLVKIVELLFRTLAAGRLMSKYGIKLGLLLLPVLLLFFTIMALINFVLASYSLLFFLLLAMIKLIDKVIRRSMEEPATKTLYQPVDSDTKLLLQTTIEGKGKQLAVVLAGGILVLFNLIPNFTIAIAAIISCFLLIGWIIFAYKTYSEYRTLLSNQLAASSGPHEHQNQISGANYIRNGLRSSNQVTVQRSAFSLSKMKPDVLIPCYPKLVRHPDVHMRFQALQWFVERPVYSLIDVLKKQEGEENDSTNLQLLKEIIHTINNVLALPENHIKDLLQSEIPEDRIKAAAWICHYEKTDMAGLLNVLLKDKNPMVVKATSFYITSVKDMAFLESLWDSLVTNKSYEHSVLKTLLVEGSSINSLLQIAFDKEDKKKKFVLLEEAFRSSSQEPIILLSIINLLGQLDNSNAIEYLKSKLDIGNWNLQYHILENLKLLGFRASENDLMTLRQLIIKEASFATWILAAINDLGKGTYFSDLNLSLQEQLEGSKEKIFNILAFLYPKEAIAKIEINLKSGIQEKEVLALEMADILLDETHKDIIFPIFDNIPLADKIKNLSEHFPQAAMRREERLKNIIFYDYAMLNNVSKAFAIKALMTLTKEPIFEITAQIYGKNDLLKEEAYLSIYQQNEESFNYYVNKESERDRLHFARLSSDFMKEEHALSRFEIIQLLKSNSIFGQLPFWEMDVIAKFFSPLVLEINNQIIPQVIQEDKIHIFLKGAISLMSLDGMETELKHGDLIGFYDESLAERTIVVHENSLLLTILKSNFYLILEGYPKVAEVVYNLCLAEDLSPKGVGELEDEMYLEQYAQ